MFTTRRRGIDSSRHSILFRCCGLCISLLQLCFTTADDPNSQTLTTNTANPTSNTELGPYWDLTTQSIFFVDRDPGKIRRYHPENNTYYSSTLDIPEATSNFTLQKEFFHHVSFVIPVQNQPNLFAVGLGKSVGVIEWDGSNNATINFVLDGPLLITAGTTDANGMLYLATTEGPDEFVAYPFGTLCSVTSGGGLFGTKRLMGLRDAIVFNENSTNLYYTDASSRVIRGLHYNIKTFIFYLQFDYDVEYVIHIKKRKPDILYTMGFFASRVDTHANEKIVFDFVKESLPGTPRGLAVDSEGNLWVACARSENIYGINPTTGELIQTIPLPAVQTTTPRVTSLVFAGPNLDQLYATTATSSIAIDAEPPLLRVIGFNGSVTGVPGVPVVMPKRKASTLPPIA